MSFGEVKLIKNVARDFGSYEASDYILPIQTKNGEYLGFGVKDAVSQFGIRAI